MHEAATTWALVVGIDVYDSDAVRPLQGPVADACETVAWLRKLGVPDGQILLHASPGAHARPALDALGIPYLDGREPTIWGSIATLRGVTTGTRLFVYLFGHGLYDPESGRLFLTQEAGVGDAYANLGIDLYTKLLLSTGFRNQYLVMDGCLNYPYDDGRRPTVVAAMHSGVAGFTPKPENALVACFAASQDQRAAEIEGRGAFARRFLAAADPDTPMTDAVDYDFVTGQRRFDVGRAMAHLIPVVSGDAAGLAPAVAQTPQVFRWGRAGSETTAPMFTFPATGTRKVRFALDPGEATGSVRRLRVAIDDPPYWEFSRPSAQGEVELPVDLMLPDGAAAQAECRLAPDGVWADPDRAIFVADDERTVTLSAATRQGVPLSTPTGSMGAGMGDLIGAGSGSLEFRVELRDEGGSPAWEFLDASYAAAAVATGSSYADHVFVGPPGVEVTPHESGPVVTVASHAMDEGIAFVDRLVGAMRTVTPAGHDLRVVTPGDAPTSVLRFQLAGSAADLAGFLVDEKLVTLSRPGGGEPIAELSAGAIAANPAIAVEPGAVEVTIDLPWGSWVQTVRVPTVGEAVIDLPGHVGVPPLRNRYAADPASAPRFETGTVWSVAGDGPVPVTGSDGDVGALTQVGTIGEAVHWAFPLNPLGALLVDPSPQHPRVEPLSIERLPAWDLLVTSGRLEGIDPEQVVVLTDAKWADFLVGLAGGYAVYAAGGGEFLRVVSGNLVNLAPFPLIDTALLRLASALEPGVSGPQIDSYQAAEELDAMAGAGSVPLFRWGVPLALRLARQTGVGAGRSEWYAALERIAVSLVPTSVWTMWRAD